jgi:hypothetical protein
MIRIDDPTLYGRSLAVLNAFTRHNYLGRLVQIFLAAKHNGKAIPQIGDPTGIDTASLQRLLDELYVKLSRPSNSCVLSLFSNNHLALTGVSGANNWRNNFDFQKGFTCYASVPDLLNPAFRSAPRIGCPYLVPSTGVRAGTLEGASCSLVTSATYRREDHEKVMRRDPSTRAVTIYDPNDVSFYLPIVAPAGRRPPIVPLVVALYHDSHLASGRTGVTVEDFAADFDFSMPELVAYFDDDPASAENASLISDFPGLLSWNRFTSLALTVPPAPLPSIPPPALPRSRPRRSASAPAFGITTVAPPAGNHWWHAEQAVATALLNLGWSVKSVGPFGLGFDLIAEKGGVKRYVEVKSSSGPCSPSLTENEYNEACRLRSEYVLAIVEKFDPSKPVTIIWVQDPAHIRPTKRQVLTFSMPRSQWLPKSVGTFP